MGWLTQLGIEMLQVAKKAALAPTTVGTIEVMCGPMFSGKSNALVGRILELEAAGEKVQAFRPSRDTRDARAEIVSRTGACYPATRILTYEGLDNILEDDTTVVAFDEPNLLPEGFIETCLGLSVRGYRVLVSALNLDYRGKPIPPMSDILCYPSQVTYLVARCSCGAPATRTHRTSSSRQTILVGDAESYVPVCAPCFMALNDGMLVF